MMLSKTMKNKIEKNSDKALYKTVLGAFTQCIKTQKLAQNAAL